MDALHLDWVIPFSGVRIEILLAQFPMFAPFIPVFQQRDVDLPTHSGHRSVPPKENKRRVDSQFYDWDLRTVVV